MIASDAAVESFELRLAAEELVVLCRGHEAGLALLLPELADLPAPDVVERTLIARGLLELDRTSGTRPDAFAGEIVEWMCAPNLVEHVTVDELGGGPGWWEAIAHADEAAVTVTPTHVAGVYSVVLTGPYEPPPAAGEPELETSIGRLETLLSARRAGTLGLEPGDDAARLVLGASAFVDRVTRRRGGSTLVVEHRAVLAAGDLGTWVLTGLPSPADGDDIDTDAPVAWSRIPDTEEERPA